MRGSYIPIVNIPENCRECEFSKSYGLVGDTYCRILDEYFTNNTIPPWKERPDECPIVCSNEGGGKRTIRLLIGGSPCTHWSIAQTKNRETTAEGTGWELFKNFLIALEKYKPDFFLYENNKSMSRAIKEQITKELGVEPILINSALVSAQSRQRLYWTNIPGVDQPEDRRIILRDILESGICWREKAYAMQTAARGTAEDMIVRGKRNGVAEPVYSPSGKPLTEAEMDYMVRETKDGRNHFAFEYFHDAGQDKSATITANTHKGVPYNVCAEPIRIGTVENDAKNKDFDSQQYRVYSPDGKAVTLCGQGGGIGAKTGLYATPIRVGDMPNAAGEISGSQSGRIHSIDGKGVPNGGGADGAATGLYAIPAGIAWRGREGGSNYEVRDDQKANAVPSKANTAEGHQSRLVIEADDGKTYPVYMVRDSQITIKGKQYPIRLADGFYIIRKLTVTECKRLQTVPDDYVFPVSDTQAYKMLGNGWTVDVIAHILGFIPGIRTEPLEVFSMYDGMACGHIALDKLGGHITRYFATEIDKYAIKTTQHNFQDVIQLGDAFQVREDGWHLPREETEKPEKDPTPDVLMFIGRFSTDDMGTRWEVVEAFTNGCCYWFAHILEARFRDQYGAHIVVDYVANHFATRIAGSVYDITGDVTEGHEWEPWGACSDPALRKRITEYCIMF